MLISDIGKQENIRRLKRPEFQIAVSMVLADLGAEFTRENFQKYDGIIDWIKYAENLTNPKHFALVEILSRGYPTGKKVLKELQGQTKAEALQKLNTRFYQFIDWWD